jgi:LPXTG-motif cell wall-anchored protein
MNISLPGQDSDKAFFAIIAISVGMVLATILFFRKKRWF